MSTVLVLLVTVPTLVAVGFAVYAFGTLVGRWDRPKAVLGPIPRQSAQAIAMPRPAMPPPPMIERPIAPPVVEVRRPAIEIHRPESEIHRSAGVVSSIDIRQAPRMAKGSIPPPIPSMPAMIAPVEVADFVEEDATQPENQRFSVIRSSRRASR